VVGREGVLYTFRVLHRLDINRILSYDMLFYKRMFARCKQCRWQFRNDNWGTADNRVFLSTWFVVIFFLLLKTGGISYWSRCLCNPYCQPKRPYRRSLTINVCIYLIRRGGTNVRGNKSGNVQGLVLKRQTTIYSTPIRQCECHCFTCSLLLWILVYRMGPTSSSSEWL